MSMSGFGQRDSLVTLEDTRDQLSKRFPQGDMKFYPGSGEVSISLPLKDGGTRRFCLTWQQAKYLAYSELTGDDLKERRFPADWPKGPRKTGKS
jgi:hypothetical protein